MKKYEMVKVYGTPYLVVEIDGDRFGGLAMEDYEWSDSYIYMGDTEVEWFEKDYIDDVLGDELRELLDRSSQHVVLEAVVEVGLPYYKIYRKIEDIPENIKSRIILGKICPDETYSIASKDTGIFITINDGDEFYTNVLNIKDFLKDGNLLYDYSKEDLKKLIEVIKREIKTSK